MLIRTLRKSVELGFQGCFCIREMLNRRPKIRLMDHKARLCPQDLALKPAHEASIPERADA